jgi:signal transduction histidine kinase
MLSVFFICLLIPLSLIVYYGFKQFENEVEFRYQEKSVNVLKQINKVINTRMKKERKRPINHYNFYQEVSNPLTGSLSYEISPLANPDSYPENIGLIGYFQINADKTLSSPLLPYQTKAQLAQANTNLKWQEIERRMTIIDKIRDLLLANNFVIKDGDENSIESKTLKIPTGSIRKEAFQVKIDKRDEVVVFRNFWLNDAHYIQGFIADKNRYLNALFRSFLVQGHYENTVQVRLKVIHSAEPIIQYLTYSFNNNGKSYIKISEEPNPEYEQSYIYHGHVITPFQKVELRFMTNNYPLGTVSEFIVFFLVILIILIILIVCGCLGFYRLGIKEIELAEQRMNFVSSVSHELKTPLTSILMYSEMLKSQMVADPDIQREYQEFIYNESGRLSRLINNILRLANLNSQQNLVNIEYMNVRALQSILESKIASMIGKNAFNILFYIDDSISPDAEILIDVDAFSQIVINLVDNSIKFFNAANITAIERRQIIVRFCADRNTKNKIIFSIRDFGPGITSAEQKRVFELFYRSGNEMTRTTPGTGIGLALVNELVIAQGGKIKIHKKDQGVEFLISFNSR